MYSFKFPVTNPISSCLSYRQQFIARKSIAFRAFILLLDISLQSSPMFYWKRSCGILLESVRPRKRFLPSVAGSAITGLWPTTKKKAGGAQLKIIAARYYVIETVNSLSDTKFLRDTQGCLRALKARKQRCDTHQQLLYWYIVLESFSSLSFLFLLARITSTAFFYTATWQQHNRWRQSVLT